MRSVMPVVEKLAVIRSANSPLEHQRAMVGIGLHHTLEEVVVAQVAQALAFKTGFLHTVEFLGYA